MAFFDSEKALSDTATYLKLHAEIYTRSIREKQDAEESKKADWVIVEYRNRIAYTRDRLEKAYVKFEATLEKITKTSFFNMIKLTVQLKQILENNGRTPQDFEPKKQALQLLLEDAVFPSPKIAESLEKAGIQLGPFLKLVCSQNWLDRLKAI